MKHGFLPNTKKNSLLVVVVVVVGGGGGGGGGGGDKTHFCLVLRNIVIIKYDSSLRMFSWQAEIYPHNLMFEMHDLIVGH